MYLYIYEYMYIYIYICIYMFICVPRSDLTRTSIPEEHDFPYGIGALFSNEANGYNALGWNRVPQEYSPRLDFCLGLFGLPGIVRGLHFFRFLSTNRSRLERCVFISQPDQS